MRIYSKWLDQNIILKYYKNLITISIMKFMTKNCRMHLNK